jgi:hypothetical protein
MAAPSTEGLNFGHRIMRYNPMYTPIANPIIDLPMTWYVSACDIGQSAVRMLRAFASAAEEHLLGISGVEVFGD